MEKLVQARKVEKGIRTVPVPPVAVSKIEPRRGRAGVKVKCTLKSFIAE
jgi:hypothetical protein